MGSRGSLRPAAAAAAAALAARSGFKHPFSPRERISLLLSVGWDGGSGD